MKYLLTFVFIAGSVVLQGQVLPEVDSLGLTGAQLETAYEKRHLLLVNNSSGKKKKLKEGGFAIIKLVGDTARMDVILDAFLSDTIIVYKWKHHSKGQVANHHLEFKLVPIKSIETIEYNVRHEHGVFWTSLTMVVAGFNFAVLPVIMPLILGNTEEVYTQPQFPFIVIGGTVLFVAGLKLQKQLNPVVYHLGTDWSYRVVAK